MTVGNRWLWFHILSGGFIAKVAPMILQNYSPFAIVAIMAVFWEIIELYWEGWRTYGSVKNWIADSLGDILGALLMAWVVLA